MIRRRKNNEKSLGKPLEIASSVEETRTDDKTCMICDKSMRCSHYLLCSYCMFGVNKCGCRDNMTTLHKDSK